ncbi:MAG: hypothetical protein ACETWD_11425 [Desulfatiglandales bacterium]
MNRSIKVSKPILVYIAALTAGFLYASPSWAATVQVEVIHSQDRYQTAGTYPIALRLRISSPWCIHCTKTEARELMPTVLCFRKCPELKVEGIRFPEPERKKFDYTPAPINVFSGDILVRATLVINENASTGEQVVTGDLSYQACSSNVCLLPEKVPISMPVSIVPRGISTTALNQDIFFSGNEEDFE